MYMTKLSSIADYVTDKISSNDIALREYVTTDCILQNKKGREIATNLPPQSCCLTRYQRGDVLIANIRPYLKKVWFADIDGGASSDVLVFRVKEGHSPSFLYAVLLQDSFFDYVMQGAKGSKMPRGDKEQILRYEMPTLSCSEESIGTFFLNLDQKIRLNEQINQNLETMAKQLYVYWFVQFDFPNEEGKPYKSSGGEMVWNEKLKREIPKGWNVIHLGKLCSFRNGINYAKDEIGAPFPIVNVRNISSSTILLDGEDFDEITVPSKKAENYILTDKDIVIARSGCPGSTRLLQHPNNTLFCGFIICCTPNDSGMRSYLTYILKGLEGTSATTSGGSILQNVSQDTLKSLWVILPQMDVLKQFDKMMNTLLNQMYSNLMNTKKLTKQRDELLPLLMNGQVLVNSDLSAYKKKERKSPLLNFKRCVRHLSL
ncbi:restriction endonuclease subunit S [Butyricimonas faecihominis]|uniref:restriction endonuclease subunit S n=1 Tax=Butyricimonas faecihominis TaxID=1472416 RepID=UPI003D7273C0